MCKATRLIDQQIQIVEQERKSTSQSVSKWDTELSLFYHSVEHRKFNAAEGYYIAKELQRILRERRKVKFEDNQMRALIDNLKNVKKRLKEVESNYFRGADEAHKEYIKS